MLSVELAFFTDTTHKKIRTLIVEVLITLEVGSLRISLQSLGSCRWNLPEVLLDSVAPVPEGVLYMSSLVACGGLEKIGEG